MKRRDGFRYEVDITPAFDRRDPDPSKNYGIHCCDLFMVLAGPAGAVEFRAFTGWNLPHVNSSSDGLCAASLAYRSPTPRYSEQTPTKGECDYVRGEHCYYDVRFSGLDEWADALVREGSRGIWALLEAEYDKLFGTPAESAEGTR